MHLQEQQGRRALSVSDSTLKRVASCLGFTDLKKEQKEAVREFVGGKDVFVSLPTGFGKSLCYIALPGVFDVLRSVEKQSMILVVSPLLALMKDQVASITKMGVSAVYVSDKKTSSAAVMRSLAAGEYQVIFASPEALFQGTQQRTILCSNAYQENLMAFVIDEAHCVKKW